MSYRSSPPEQVGDTDQPDNATPSLHPHYKDFLTTADGSAPRFCIGILPRGVCHLSFPFASKARFSRSVLKPVASSCHLYTGCRLDSKQESSRLILERILSPSFDSKLIDNDASSDGLLSLIFSLRT
jgi:hypothetical protein